MFSAGVFMGMSIFQIDLEGVYGLHVPHSIVSVLCSVRLALVWSWSWLSQSTLSICTGLFLDSAGFGWFWLQHCSIKLSRENMISMFAAVGVLWNTVHTNIQIKPGSRWVFHYYSNQTQVQAELTLFQVDICGFNLRPMTHNISSQLNHGKIMHAQKKSQYNLVVLPTMTFCIYDHLQWQLKLLCVYI